MKVASTRWTPGNAKWPSPVAAKTGGGGGGGGGGGAWQKTMAYILWTLELRTVPLPQSIFVTLVCGIRQTGTVSGKTRTSFYITDSRFDSIATSSVAVTDSRVWSRADPNRALLEIPSSINQG